MRQNQDFVFRGGAEQVQAVQVLEVQVHLQSTELVVQVVVHVQSGKWVQRCRGAEVVQRWCRGGAEVVVQRRWGWRVVQMCWCRCGEVVRGYR